MPDTQPPRRPGRPRQWASEAERKRAYRARKAAELAEPLQLREALREAEGEAAQARGEAEAAALDVSRWQRRAAAAEKTLSRARAQAARARARAERSTAERDEARRLLRRKLQHARHITGDERVRDDAPTLVAIIAELYKELELLRRENQRFRAVLQLPPGDLDAFRRKAERLGRRS